MFLNKTKLLEQCRKARKIDTFENSLFNQEYDSWWIDHNKGHELILEKLVKLLEVDKLPRKYDILKWLKKDITNSNKIIKNLDMKYNKFKNNEELNEQDSYIYSFNDGIVCEAILLISIVKGKTYLSK